MDNFIVNVKCIIESEISFRIDNKTTLREILNEYCDKKGEKAQYSTITVNGKKFTYYESDVSVFSVGMKEDANIIITCK